MKIINEIKFTTGAAINNAQNYVQNYDGSSSTLQESKKAFKNLLIGNTVGLAVIAPFVYSVGLETLINSGNHDVLLGTGTHLIAATVLCAAGLALTKAVDLTFKGVMSYKDKYEPVEGFLVCKNSSTNQYEELNRKDALKMIENKVFSEKYSNVLTSFGEIAITSISLQDAAKIPYSKNKGQLGNTVDNEQSIQKQIRTVQKECLLEENDSSKVLNLLKKLKDNIPVAIKDKISQFREKAFGKNKDKDFKL